MTTNQLVFNKKLTPSLQSFLYDFQQRRYIRNVDNSKYGYQGEFFIGDTQPEVNTDYEFNHPITQPSYHCCWRPTQDGLGLTLNYPILEKSDEWLSYLINKIFIPNGYIINGCVNVITYGLNIVVKDNIITVNTVDSSYTPVIGLNMRLDYVYIDTPPKKEKKSGKDKLISMCSKAFEDGYIKRITEQLHTALKGGEQSSSYNSKELQESIDNWLKTNNIT